MPGATRNPRWLAVVNRPSAALILILLATAARLLWHSLFSSLTLIEDEAHYWLWATQLDWSYYSKGPGVAWLIALSTSVFGHSEFAIRLPAALAAAIGAFAAADATRTISSAATSKGAPSVRDGPRLANSPHHTPHTAAFIAAILYLLAPALALTGFLMTIDAPMLASWMVAVALTLRATSSPRLWPAVGLALALGFLFKYTIVLLLPGILWVMWHHRTPRRRYILLLLVASLGLLPILLWNAQHDWATARHLLGHLGVQGGDTGPKDHASIPITSRALWSLEYLGLLLFLAGPVPMILLITQVFRRFPLPTRTADTLRLAIPLAAFYLVVSLITQTEGNWAIAAPVTLIPAAAWAIMHGVRHNIWPIRFLWGATLVAGLGTWLAAFGAHTIARVPALEFLPTHRAMGMNQHAAAVQAHLDQLELETAQPPFILTGHYGIASQLAFYLPDQPDILCASAHTGGRRSQFDLWPHTDLANPETQRRLAARPVLILGGDHEDWIQAFEHLIELEPLPTDPKQKRRAFLAYGYRGFSPQSQPPAHPIP